MPCRTGKRREHRVGMDEEEAGGDRRGRAWIHRQNIARYKALLANPARQEDHRQIRALLREEEEMLRGLGEA